LPRCKNPCMGDETVRRRVVVHGRVQGVFFRDSTQSEAQSAGVAGWVRNRDDGAVEAVIEGPADAVERVVGFMQSGPSRADVDDIEVTAEDPEGLDGFEVR
jgi:acylphosphatase